jgi:capsular polysaccharide biosynthesis protein
MPSAFKIISATEIADKPLLISRFARAVEEPHQPFLGGRGVLATLDLREPLVPPIGTTISEPGLAERWRRYDRDYRAEARVSRFWVTEIPDATVYPPFGIVARGDMLVRDTIRHSKMLSSIFPTQSQEHFLRAMGTPGAAIFADAPRAKRHVPGHSFLLGFGMFENYFNWTLRYASRVAIYQAMPQPCRLVVPAPIKRYVAETLEFLGVPPEQIEYLDGPLSFERLTLMSPVALGRYELSPLITSTLREHPRLTELPRGRKRRLYIPRRNVRMRRVVNESAVEAALEALGFEVFDNSEYRVREQASAFRDAEIIVAPHGAGLANIVYCDASTPIIELVPEGYDQGVTSYRSLADLFGLRYIQLFAQEAAPDRKGNRCNADIELDVAELVRTVETELY